MTHYSVQLRDWKFVKRYGLLYFAKNMSNIIDKNIGENVNIKYSQKTY